MSAALGERLRAAGAQAVAAFQALDPGDRGGLLLALAAALAAVLVLSLPPRRGEGGVIWPRLWVCGTLGGLGALILFLPR